MLGETRGVGWALLTLHMETLRKCRNNWIMPGKNLLTSNLDEAQ
jgi:hypothetical protein